MFLPPRLLVRSLLALCALAAAYSFLRASSCGADLPPLFPVTGAPAPPSLSLSEAQCRARFPLLMKEIDDAAAAGPFWFNRSVDAYTGQVHARIKDGKLLVISIGDQWSQDMINERSAVLNQIHRAMITSPTPLPDTIFTVSVIDNPRKYAWSFSRPSSPNDRGEYWVMPHFSFWSWPKAFIGTLDDALGQIRRVEAATPWRDKIDRAVWRGSVHFNSIWNLNLRPELVRMTRGKEWADVQGMEWENQGESAKNSIAIEDFCKYKYILYTEGITYSGRLPFHQACSSLIITPPPNYLLHTTHLMRPLFSATLPLSSSAKPRKNDAEDARWPRSYPPSEANIVFVDQEWTDLESTIEYLRAHSEVAEGIARRQRKMIAEAGYLSVAAEVCYWRALIRSWSRVSMTDEGMWKDKDGRDGTRWETFLLRYHIRR